MARKRILAPADWNAETSFRQWFPDEETHTAVRAKRTAIHGKKGAARKKALVDLVALFPSKLRKLVGDDITIAYAIDSIPSPEVTAVALALIESAPRARTVAQVDAITSTLERILPDLPLLSLPHAIGFKRYTKLVNATMTKDPSSPVAFALSCLRDYLSDS